MISMCIFIGMFRIQIFGFEELSIIQIKGGMADCKKGREFIKHHFDQTVQLIRQEYSQRIEQLHQKIADLQSVNSSLMDDLRKKDEELAHCSAEQAKMKGEIQRYESLVLTLERANERVIGQAEEKLKARDVEIDRLASELKEVSLEVKQLRSMDSMSLDQSTISMNQEVSQNFSFEISELFRHFPTEISNFLGSIEGDLVSDPKQVGDMVVMFVSKDNLSLEKYLNVNRTFLKRKIKEHNKRFRYVLIHKPDK